MRLYNTPAILSDPPPLWGVLPSNSPERHKLKKNLQPKIDSNPWQTEHLQYLPIKQQIWVQTLKKDIPHHHHHHEFIYFLHFPEKLKG